MLFPNRTGPITGRRNFGTHISLRRNKPFSPCMRVEQLEDRFLMSAGNDQTVLRLFDNSSFNGP